MPGRAHRRDRRRRGMHRAGGARHHDAGRRRRLRGCARPGDSRGTRSMSRSSDTCPPQRWAPPRGSTPLFDIPKGLGGAAEEVGHRAYEGVKRPAAAAVQPGRSPPGDRSLVVAGSMATAPRVWSQAPEPLAGPSRTRTAGGGPGVERGRVSGRLTRPAMRCGPAAPRSSRSPCRRLPLRGRAGTRWARPTR